MPKLLEKVLERELRAPHAFRMRTPRSSTAARALSTRPRRAHAQDAAAGGSHRTLQPIQLLAHDRTGSLDLTGERERATPRASRPSRRINRDSTCRERLPMRTSPEYSGNHHSPGGSDRALAHAARPSNRYRCDRRRVEPRNRTRACEPARAIAARSPPRHSSAARRPACASPATRSTDRLPPDVTRRSRQLRAALREPPRQLAAKGVLPSLKARSRTPSSGAASRQGHGALAEQPFSPRTIPTTCGRGSGFAALPRRSRGPRSWPQSPGHKTARLPRARHGHCAQASRTLSGGAALGR